MLVSMKMVVKNLTVDYHRHSNKLVSSITRHGGVPTQVMSKYDIFVPPGWQYKLVKTRSN